MNDSSEDAVVKKSMAELMPTIGDRQDTLPLLKVVVVGILISLILKVSMFVLFDRVNEATPLIDSFFPILLRTQWVARVAYLLACGGCLIAIFSQQQKHLIAATLLMLVNLMVLTIHQAAFNDVTFMCCSWAAIWCVWFATRLHEPFASLFPRAVFLTHVILSLIFLGAAVGKVTEGYWSGQVLYEIYFEKRDFWFYNIFRAALPADQLREAATWHSRMVIFGEFVCCFLWLMPARWASVVAVVMLCGIALTNNFLLFSVVTCLIGLAIVGLHQPKSEKDRQVFGEASAKKEPI